MHSRTPAPLTPRLLTLTVLAAWSGGTLAATSPSFDLGELVVSAPRPHAFGLFTTRLAGEAVRVGAPASSDTVRLLRDVPGLALQTGGGVSSLPVLNGLADDRIRIQVDGMDRMAACPNHMNPALSYIDPSQLESVRVHAGVTPVSVGGDSLAGTIVVQSARPVFSPTGKGLRATGEIGGFYRSNGDGRGLNARLNLASESLSLRYSGATARSDNLKAGSDFKDRLFRADTAFTSAQKAPHTGRAGHTLALDEIGSTAYETINQSLGLAFKSGEHQIDFVYSRQDIPFENFVNQRMDMTKNESDQLNLGYEGQFGWGVLKARAWHEKTEHAMDFGVDKRFWYGSATGGHANLQPADCGAKSATCAHGMPMYTESRGKGLSLKGEIALADQDVLRLGTEYLAYRLDDWWPASGAGMWPNTFWNLRDGRRDRRALFGEWEGGLGARWSGLIGLRHETVTTNAATVHGYNNASFPVALPVGMDAGNQNRDAVAFNTIDRRRADHNLDFTALARFKADERQSYEFGLAQKSRSPNLYERYAWSTWQMAALMNNFVGDGNGYVGNPDLKPEVAHTLALTADWHAADRQGWGLKLTPYYSRVKDYIDAVQWNSATRTPRTTPLTDQFTVLRYLNQPARIYGLNISGFARIARDTPRGDFIASGLMSYVNGENRATGAALYNIMPLNGKLALTQKRGAWSQTLEGVFVAGKGDRSSVRNEMRTDGFSLFNWRASYEWKQARIDFGIENLFDRHHDQPLGGAYLGQGTTMTAISASTSSPYGLIPDWGTPVPGPGRSLYVGFNYRF